MEFGDLQLSVILLAIFLENIVSNSSKSPRPYRNTLSCHFPYSHTNMHEPCIALPEMFSRFSTKCKDFNTQCFLLFTSHSKDINKIPLTIFLFSRRAPDYTGLLPFITLCAVQSYNSPTANSLAQAFWEVFDHPVSAADYALSFWTLITYSWEQLKQTCFEKCILLRPERSSPNWDHLQEQTAHLSVVHSSHHSYQ